MIRPRPGAIRAILAAGFLLAAFFLFKAAWIPAKAALGQQLLNQAWQKVLAGNSQARPWPWADTSPVAVLEVPQLGVRQLVLSGASGRNLAWGPVWQSPGSAEHANDVILSGHRDTHFRFLKDLKAGDELVLGSRHGARHYRVQYQEIINADQTEMLIEPGLDRLTLVTCYPFDALQAGGPLRYVVTAVPVSSFIDNG